MGRTVPRETILSKVKEAGRYLPVRSSVSPAPTAPHERKTKKEKKRSTATYVPPQGYTLNSEGRLVFQRLKDEVKFATATAAVRSILEHHQRLLQSLGLRSGGGAPGSDGPRSFVALVLKDAAKAGGYRLCMRYFGSRLPAAVPWAIDALVRGETLSRGIQEVLQIGTIPLLPCSSSSGSNMVALAHERLFTGGRRAVLGVVRSAMPIGGLPSFLLIGAGWWAVEKGARSILQMFADDGDLTHSSTGDSSATHKKKDNKSTKKKQKARL
jgi:hypothetical protein